MFRAVENEHLASDSLGRDQVGVLGHIPRPVHFPCMVDLLYDLNAGLGRDGVAAQLAPLVVVVCAVELIRGGAAIALWDLNSSNLEVVLRLAGGVCSEEEAMGSVWFVGGSRLG